VLFEGEELREMLGRTPNQVELRNDHGRCCRILTCAEALALDMDLFVGVGNLRRIRFIRRRTERFELNAGSKTTIRLENEAGIAIAGPWIRQHRPLAE